MGNSVTRAIRVAQRQHPGQAVNEDILQKEASRVTKLQATAELVNSKQDQPLKFQGSEDSLEKLLRGIQSRPAFPARPKIINNNKAKEQYELLQEGRITTVTLRSLLEDPRFRNTQKNGNLAKLGSLAREYGVDEKSLVKLVSYCYLPTVQAVSDGRLVALPVANDE